MRLALGASLLLTGLAACATTDADGLDTLRKRESSVDGAANDEKAPKRDGGDEVMPAPTTPAALPPLPTPKLVGVDQKCKLINGAFVDDPAPNNLHFKTNLKGTDLGIPVTHEGTTYFFFGDSIGFKGIWDFGESQPDAVGFIDHATLARDPGALCTQMSFLRVAGNAIGPQRDARIQTDWAGIWMNPPAGKDIEEFIRNPAGRGKFPNLPGDFEVPSGVFSANGSIYAFYTTVVGPAQVEMKGSYLAKWRAPSPNGQPNLDILYHVDQRFDANGAMRGDFINNASLVVGDYVYVYGSGDYRKSPIHLARKKLGALDTEGGFERFDAVTKTWRGPREAAAPIVSVPATGELSVVFYPSVGRYMMMAQEGTPTRNQIVARFAAAPEGPWSESVVVADMGEAGWRAKYCCQGNSCQGERIFHCDRAGFYGTYLLPDVQKNGDGSFVATFVMSTWDPYNVALMQATFE